MVIGVSGAARSGKDTFFTILSKISQSNNVKCQRFAFADAIKNDLRELLINNFNIDVDKPTEHEKKMIRPLLVAYGTNLGRAIDPDFWINKIKNNIENFENSEYNDCLSVITDVRYKNEQDFIKFNFKDSINVYLEREGCHPANEEEEKHCPILKENSDIIIKWNNLNGDLSAGFKYISPIYLEKFTRRQTYNQRHKERC